MSGPFLLENNAQQIITLSCVSYLTSSFMLIDPEYSEITAKRSVVKGYHSLQFYANEFWLQHLLALSSDPNTCFTDTKYKTLLERLRNLCNAHKKIQSLRNYVPSLSATLGLDSPEIDLDCLNYEPTTKKLASQVLAFRQAIKHRQTKELDSEGNDSE